MNLLKCMDCNYNNLEKYGKNMLPECGLIELLMLRDIHMRTFKHRMEIETVS